MIIFKKLRRFYLCQEIKFKFGGLIRTKMRSEIFKIKEKG